MWACAALTEDQEVIAWGNPKYGGDVGQKLENKQVIHLFFVLIKI